MSFPLKLISKNQETEDVTSFHFQIPESFGWIPGQYLKYFLDHPNADNRGISRYFTIASAPSEKEVILASRFAQDRSSTFKETLKNLPEGVMIEADGPRGSFTYQDPSQEAIFIAGGIGITPFRSILVDLDSKNIAPKITLLYGNRDENIPFKDLLDSLAKKYPSFKIVYVTGIINKDSLIQNVQDLNTPAYYVSGPEPMVEGISQLLTSDLGIPKEKIKEDFFPGYTP